MQGGVRACIDHFVLTIRPVTIDSLFFVLSSARFSSHIKKKNREKRNNKKEKEITASSVDPLQRPYIIYARRHRRRTSVNRSVRAYVYAIIKYNNIYNMLLQYTVVTKQQHRRRTYSGSFPREHFITFFGRFRRYIILRERVQ